MSSVRKTFLIALATAFLSGAASEPAAACTAFCAPGNVVAKSYDWDMEQGLVVINKRGMAKEALTLNPADRPARWTSRFGSVTFNQYGREMPCSGMNEAGLVIEALWLKDTKVSSPDRRPAITELQWIQYQLDNHRSVADVVAHAQDVRVSVAHGKVHYFIADRLGQSAAVEHLHGKLVVTTGAAMPLRALANHPYGTSLDHWARIKGTPAAVITGDGSLARFSRIASISTSRHRPSDPVTAAFRYLDMVRNPDTRWQLVYLPTNGTVWFRTTAERAVKRVDLRSFDLSCGPPAQMLDMATPSGGDARERFVPYAAAANTRLVESSLKGIAGQLPPGATAALAAYPERLRCGGTGR